MAMKVLLTAILAAALPVPTPAPPALDWHACAENAQCAVLTVPADWNDPGGPAVDLPVARRPATDQAHKVGTLGFGPRGPWASAVYRATRAYAGSSATLLSRFDIVSFDPRGSLGGRPIPCETDPAGP